MTSAEEVEKTADKLERKVFHGPTMEAVHTKTIEWQAAALLRTLLRERDEARSKALDEAAEFLKNRAQIYRDEAHDQKQWGNRVAENGALVAARALANAVAPILSLKDTQT